LNPSLQGLITTVPLNFKPPYNITVLDLTFSEATMASTYAEIGIRGTVNASDGSHEYPWHAPSVAPIPPSVRDSHMVALSLTPLVVNTFTYQLAAAGLLTKEIDDADIPSSIHLRLNTKTFKDICPELYQKYGTDGAPMSIIVDGNGAQYEPGLPVLFTDNSFTGSLPVSFNFTVGTDMSPAFTISCPMNVSMGLSVSHPPGSSQILELKLNEVDCSPLRVTASDYGPVVGVSTLGALLKFVSDKILVPLANDILGNGVPFPDTDTVKFNNTVIMAQSDTISLLSDIVWIPHVGGH